MLLLLRSLLDGTYVPPDPEPTPQSNAGTSKKPLVSSAWHWSPFNPQQARRPRKKRVQDIFFLGK